REIARAADLYLDSFPYTGATTVCEALSVGTPVITREGDGLRERPGASWVRAYDLESLVAATADDYVATAVRFACDPAMRARLKSKVEALAASAEPPHCATTQFGKAFSDALWRIAEQSDAFDLSHWRAGAGADTRPLPSKIAPPPAAPPFATQRDRKMVRVAILSSPRTGSTILCNLLNGTRGHLCHYELFHADMIQYADREELGEGALAQRDADPVRFLSEVFDSADDDGYALCGFKHFDHLSPEVTDAVMADRSIRLIHLVRENVLAQFSSEEIAADGNRWFAGSRDATAPARLIQFDAERFEAFRALKQDILTRRTAAFAAHERAPLFLDYTVLTAPRTAARLTDFLGVEVVPRDAYDFARQNTAEILERFSNPEAVSAHLAAHGLERWSHGG
ncbi:MAG: hypothetical protein AAGF49_09160, partial [Pseudomonadota bacterium]